MSTMTKIILTDEDLQEFDNQAAVAGISSDVIEKFNKVDGNSANSLPVGQEFTFDRYEIVKSELDGKDTSYIKMFTTCGHVISLGAITRICLSNTNASLLNPIFKKASKTSTLAGHLVLAETKGLSPDFKQWVNFNGFSPRETAVALAKGTQKFKATEVATLTYFPEDGERLKDDQLEVTNAEGNKNGRLALCTPKKLYNVVRVG